MSYPDIFLKKHEDKRLRKGHLWVFSNEIDTKRSPLTDVDAGDLVNIKDTSGKSLGTAYINPNTLISARLLSRKTNLRLGEKFFKSRFNTALILREALYSKPYYRFIFGDSDGLSGLVIDRFSDVFSVQITTAGMDKQQQIIVNTLIDLFSPSVIVLKNDNPQRKLEGLSTESEVIYGSLPDEIEMEENNCLFKINILTGQKTGWFYDHRNSRAQTAALAKDKRVLDLFSYAGAWGIPAAKAGASEVTCVDSSESALQMATKSAELNQLSDRMKFVRSDVFEFLKTARENKETYDIIILDPPALIKRKKDFKAGYEAYRRLNHLALQVLAKNGILVSASCSHHLTRDNLHEILRSSARHIDRHFVFFAQGGQGGDHPIHPALAETDYLKTYFCSVSSSL